MSWFTKRFKLSAGVSACMPAALFPALTHLSRSLSENVQNIFICLHFMRVQWRLANVSFAPFFIEKEVPL